MSDKFKIAIIGNATAVGFNTVADVRIHDKYQSSTEKLEEIVPWADVVFVCVPTPTDFDNCIQDLSIVEDVVEQCVSLGKSTGTVIAIKSTITPGTTARLIRDTGYGGICFNPEFLTERSAYFDFINTARIIIGGEKDANDLLKAVYQELFGNRRQIFCTDPTTAELVKYTANCFFAVKVMFFNEIAEIAAESEVDYDELIDMVLADGRIGNSHLRIAQDGHLGFGGKCFPKDITALIAYAKRLGLSPEILEAAWDKNLAMREVRDWLNIPGASTESKHGGD